MILPLDSNLEPEVDGGYWELVSSDELIQADERARCAEEPWYWLVNWVYTEEKDKKTGMTYIERFPPYPYLRYIFHRCFTDSKLAIDKSRQLLLSWIMMAYEVYHAQFCTNQTIVCQTKKEKDADDELLRRGEAICRHQPTWLVGSFRWTFCRLVFLDTNSKILGIPSGKDQIRSRNPNRVFLDEGGFFEGEFEDCRTAALACCGDVKCVSTPNAGEWDDFINDRLVA